MTILPLTYLGNTEYFRRLMADDCVIDLYEHYVKQTGRNRCEIMTSGGAALLTVNVVKGSSMLKRPVCDMRIDYSKRWQHQHWMSIVSAYANSPYFDHYGGLFEPFYRTRYTFLADFNMGLLETVTSALGMCDRLRFSTSYIEAAADDCDMRGAFDTWAPHGRECTPLGPYAPARPYEQVFADRLPFEPYLSIIDMLFCEGPSAVGLLV